MFIVSTGTAAVLPYPQVDRSTVVVRMAEPAPALHSVINFRDIGGYTTADGHTIRRGLLFRSAHLGVMSREDKDRILGLGIRHEIDLRCPKEIAENPSKWGTRKIKVSYPFTPICNVDPKTIPVTKTLGDGYAFDAIFHKESIGGIFRQLSRTKEPVLIHCTAGADRTGYTIAILMRVLGVPADQIAGNYVLTNQYWRTPEGLAEAHRLFPKSPEINSANWPGLEGKTLTTMFADIDRRYGSFERYVRDGLKLSPEDRALLRTKFLRP